MNIVQIKMTRSEIKVDRYGSITFNVIETPIAQLVSLFFNRVARKIDRT